MTLMNASRTLRAQRSHDEALPHCSDCAGVLGLEYFLQYISASSWGMCSGLFVTLGPE